ncbi:MAG: hypothetical protein ABIK65_05280 [Candidatus Eisenbacteria bacterium]
MNWFTAAWDGSYVTQIIVWGVQCLGAALIYLLYFRRSFDRVVARRILSRAEGEGVPGALHEARAHPANRYAQALLDSLERVDGDRGPEGEAGFSTIPGEVFLWSESRYRLLLVIAIPVAVVLPTLMGGLGYFSGLIHTMEVFASTPASEEAQQVLRQGIAASRLSMTVGLGTSFLLGVVGAVLLVLSGRVNRRLARLNSDRERIVEVLGR